MVAMETVTNLFVVSLSLPQTVDLSLGIHGLGLGELERFNFIGKRQLGAHGVTRRHCAVSGRVVTVQAESFALFDFSHSENQLSRSDFRCRFVRSFVLIVLESPWKR